MAEVRGSLLHACRVAAEALPRARTLSERTALLAAIAALLGPDDECTLQVPLTEFVGYPRRALWNAPKRAARDLLHNLAAYLPSVLGRAELPDAPPLRDFTFFRVEDFLCEAAAAGLSVVKRVHCTFSLRRLDACGAGTAAALPRLPAVEWEHLAELMRTSLRIGRALERKSPRQLIAGARAEGKRAARRNRAGRAGLRELIGWTDALTPGRRGCYRRMLVELASDAGAAEETVYLALDAGGHGHAWLEDDAAGQRAYDVTFPIAAKSDSEAT